MYKILTSALVLVQPHLVCPLYIKQVQLKCNIWNTFFNNPYFWNRS